MPVALDFAASVADLDPVVRAYWDLVPEINKDLGRVRLSHWGGSGGAAPQDEGEAPAPVDAATDTVTAQPAAPVAAAVKSPVRTFSQKRDEIVALWRRDRRFADLLDHDVVAVVDDEDDDGGSTQAAQGSKAAESAPDPDGFQAYAERHFLPNRGGLLSAAESAKDRAAFATTLKKPLLLGADTGLAPASAKAFKKITTYMGDRKSSKSPRRQCRELLEMALRSPDAVRDEIFALLCKQCNMNPNPDSLVRGWRLLSLCAGHFPPSAALLPILTEFLKSGAEHSSPEVREVAAYALANLRSVQRNGARTVAASNPEIAACELRRPVVIKIRHAVLGIDALRVAVESQTTARAVVQAVSVRLGITIPSAFGLSLPRHKHRRELAHYEKVLDVVAECRPDPGKSEDPTADLDLATAGLDVGFAFSARLFQAARLPSYSDAELDLVWARTAEDVLAGHYPAEEKDVMALAVMHAYIAFLAVPDTVRRDVDWVSATVPVEIVQKRSRPYLEQRLRTEAAKLAGRARRDVQLDYVRYTYQWDTAGGTFFAAVRSLADDHAVILCVTERGLHLVDPVTRAETRLFPYARIKTYGEANGELLHVTSGTDHHEFRAQFATYDARLIHGLLDDYISVLASTYTRSTARNA